MNDALSQATLERENQRYLGSGARSQENCALGFCPAFLDVDTGCVYASCFRDGRPAPCHLLDGLPDEVVLARDATGKVAAVKRSLISGFVLEQQFFSRDEAAAWVERQSLH